MTLVLWKGLVYTKILNPDRKKKIKIWNLELQIEDVVCPIFIGKNLIEKRIFELWEKNELIFSYFRSNIVLEYLSENWINYFFSFYKKLSIDEKNVYNYLFGYTKDDKDYVLQLLQSLNLSNLNIFSDGKYLIINWVKDLNLENIEDIISFLILGILFYGDIQIKKGKLISFKIFWKILTPKMKQDLDFILAKLAEYWIFIKSDLLKWKDYPIYQFFSNDWELIQSLLNITFEKDLSNYPYEIVLRKVSLLCKKYSCLKEKENFIWKIISYG